MTGGFTSIVAHHILRVGKKERAYTKIFCIYSIEELLNITSWQTSAKSYKIAKIIFNGYSRSKVS